MFSKKLQTSHVGNYDCQCTVRCTGAQDFLPDFVAAPRWYTIYGIYPKYRSAVSAMAQVRSWLKTARVSCDVTCGLQLNLDEHTVKRPSRSISFFM